MNHSTAIFVAFSLLLSVCGTEQKTDQAANFTEVLKDGPMALSMLEGKIGRWVEQQM